MLLICINIYIEDIKIPLTYASKISIADTVSHNLFSNIYAYTSAYSSQLGNKAVL